MTFFQFLTQRPFPASAMLAEFAEDDRRFPCGETRLKAILDRLDANGMPSVYHDIAAECWVAWRAHEKSLGK